jgi:GDPmannose 4,6-dehydratase
MLQQPKPKDYVIAAGETRSVRDFVGYARELCGFRLEWTGEGLGERGVDARAGRTVVRISLSITVQWRCIFCGGTRARR